MRSSAMGLRVSALSLRKTSSHFRLWVTMRQSSSSMAIGAGVASTNSFSASGRSTRGPVEHASTVDGDEEFGDMGNLNA